MSALVTWASVAAIGLVLCSPAGSAAQGMPTGAGPARNWISAYVVASPTNEAGFTLGRTLRKHFWALAKHPLTAEVQHQFAGDLQRPPRSGVQFELFTPGDLGVSVHFRW